MKTIILALSAVLLLGEMAFPQQPDAAALKKVEDQLRHARPGPELVKLYWTAGRLAYTPAKGNRPATASSKSIRYFEQAVALSDTLKDRDLSFESNCITGEALAQGGQIEEGKKHFMVAINASKAQKLPLKEAEGYKRLAESFKMGNSHFLVALRDERYFDEVIGYYRKSAELFRLCADAEKQCEALIRMGDYLLKQGKLQDAEKAYQEVLSMQQKTKFIHPQNPHSGLLVTNYFSGNFNTALYYGLNALENAKFSNETTDLEELHFYIGNVYRDLNQRAKAIEHYKKALLEIKTKSIDPYMYGFVLKNLIREYISDAKPDSALAILNEYKEKVPRSSDITAMLMAENNGQVYQALKEYDKAEYYYLKMVAIAERLADPIRALPSYYTLGAFYFLQQKFDKADLYLKRVYQSTKGQVPVSVLSDVSKMRYKIDSARKNYLTALEHFSEYKNLNDQIFNEKKNKQIEELQIKYETIAKDRDLAAQKKDITSLKLQGIQQQEKLRQKANIQNLTVTAIIFLSVITGLLYVLYRLKQRNNQRLQRKQDEINGQNLKLKKLVREKEWLIKEVHHRVKNNLQMVTSLLSSQSLYLKDNVARRAVMDSRQRVASMSLIHQKLYQSDNLESVNMQEYIKELVDYLRDGIAPGNAITFEVDAYDVKLEVSQAVPIGLILNEAITNAIKYAFPDRDGHIYISLLHVVRDEYQLHIADNGIGLPEGLDINKSRTLGLSLMRGLSEDIDGVFSISIQKGTRIKVTFKSRPHAMDDLTGAT